MRYRLPKGTRIKRTYPIRNMKGGDDSWGWEELATTKEAIFTDADVSAKVQDSEAIEFKIPDKDFPFIHVALRDLTPLCRICDEPYNLNWCVQDKEICGPCYNHGGGPHISEPTHCVDCKIRLRGGGYGAKGIFCKVCYIAAIKVSVK